MGDEIYGITWNSFEEDLVSVYINEHNNVAVPQFRHLIPFCPDGGVIFIVLTQT